MAQGSNFGSFVPTTNVWDVSQIYQVDVTSPEFKELLVRLYQNVNLIATVLNTKDTGYYDVLEFVNGQIYFPDPALNSTSSTSPSYRQVFRTVVNFGALPNTGSKSVAHNIPDINDGVTFTRIYATASDTTDFDYIPIPYASVSGDDVELSVDATNVTITTASDRTAFNITYVVLEYLKT
jgi:hypothetical protein